MTYNQSLKDLYPMLMNTEPAYGCPITDHHMRYKLSRQPTSNRFRIAHLQVSEIEN